jgi:hypothetical protein
MALRQRSLGELVEVHIQVERWVDSLVKTHADKRLYCSYAVLQDSRNRRDCIVDGNWQRWVFDQGQVKYQSGASQVTSG